MAAKLLRNIKFHRRNSKKKQKYRIFSVFFVTLQIISTRIIDGSYKEFLYHCTY